MNKKREYLSTTSSNGGAESTRYSRVSGHIYEEPKTPDNVDYVGTRPPSTVYADIVPESGVHSDRDDELYVNQQLSVVGGKVMYCQLAGTDADDSVVNGNVYSSVN